MLLLMQRRLLHDVVMPLWVKLRGQVADLQGDV
jgi:hypothetical protein